MGLLDELVTKALHREPPSRAEAFAVLRTPDHELMEVVAAGFRVRHHYFGRLVKLNYLVSLKSGLCPEDCGYCSQRAGSEAGVLTYTWLSPQAAAEAAAPGLDRGARRVCLVSSGRGPTDGDVERVARAVAAIRADHPDVEVCACLGLLSDGQAARLRDAGVDAYNHNLNTAETHYPGICSTHGFADRVSTVEQVKAAGLSACTGLIAGLGESDEDLVDVTFALRRLEPESVPVNFLMPFDGTPLAGQWQLSPQQCLRILAMVRFVCPDAEVRLAGGRELHLRSLQPLALYLANSIFLGDYLTSEGQDGERDLAMIADAGFVIEESDTGTARAVPGVRGSPGTVGVPAVPGIPGVHGGSGKRCVGGGHGGAWGHGGAESRDPDVALSGRPASEVRLRGRGAGTDLAPNA